MNGKQHILKQGNFAQETIAAYIGPAGFVLSVLAGITALLAGLGTRLNLWHFTAGFMLLKWAVFSVAAAVIFSLTEGIVVKPSAHSSAFWKAVASIVLGLIIAGIPLSWMRTARRMPPIHDITTDPADPPAFLSIMPLRANADNSAKYGGPDIAAKQRAAYPDIGPAFLPAAPAQAFGSALAVAKNMGWKIVDANAAEGRIEAVATTFWFGFRDDVVVRVTAAADGSKVDIRSVSRVGRGDIGTNATRIRAFLRELVEQRPSGTGITGA